MKNKLRFAVIGIGRFGSAIAIKLVQKGAEVIVMDSDRDKIDDIKDKVTYSVVLDATDKNALLSQNIHDMDAVVVSIGEDFQSLLLTSFLLKELNIKRIIARAQGEVEKNILGKIGITELLSPEDEVSENITESLINPNVVLSVSLPDSYGIIEMKAPKNVIGKSISEIGLRERYKINLVTILRKQEKEHHIIGVPKADTIIEEEDLIIVFGCSNNIEKFIAINE